MGTPMDTKETKPSLDSELDALFPVSTQITNHVAYGSLPSFELAAAMQSFSDTDKHLLEKAMNILFARQSKEAQTAQLEKWSAHKWRIFKVSESDYTTSPKIAAETLMSILDAKTVQVFVDHTNIVELKNGQLSFIPWCPNYVIPKSPVIRAALDDKYFQFWRSEDASTRIERPKDIQSVRTFLNFKEDENRDLTIDEIERLQPPHLDPSDLTLQHWIQIMNVEGNICIDCYGDFKDVYPNGNIYNFTHMGLCVQKFDLKLK
jgi:hypothetical protein